MTNAPTHLAAVPPVQRHRRTIDIQRAGHAAAELLESLGVEAEHMCMPLRGVQKPGARTITSAPHGLVRDDARTRQEFPSLTGGHRG